MGKTSFSNNHETCAICIKYHGERGILDRTSYRYTVDTGAKGKCLERNIPRSAWVSACPKFKPTPDFNF